MSSSNPTNSKGAAACPICRRTSDERYRPFCSRRCADIDLSHWLRGVYAIPGETGTAESEPSATTGESESGEAKSEKN